MSEKMGVGLQDLLRRFTCTDATAVHVKRRVYGGSYDYEKEGVVEIVEGRVVLDS